ncbi:hypothetical protein STAS_01687 [Striga asiatica]|uniref:Uncharacterized protein n=1 Tax=Striga asiatica TaxID=4170 RepID=A0A5A7NZU8_STRAF|nr:hypothetical protein STAS_01687 [Striga asiatica]
MSRASSSSRPLLQFDHQTPNGFAHLLQTDGTNGRKTTRAGLARLISYRARGLIDKTLRPYSLLDGLDKFFGLITGNSKELPTLLEVFEGSIGGRSFLAAGSSPELTNRGRRSSRAGIAAGVCFSSGLNRVAAGIACDHGEDESQELQASPEVAEVAWLLARRQGSSDWWCCSWWCPKNERDDEDDDDERRAIAC